MRAWIPLLLAFLFGGIAAVSAATLEYQATAYRNPKGWVMLAEMLVTPQHLMPGSGSTVTFTGKKLHIHILAPGRVRCDMRGTHHG